MRMLNRLAGWVEQIPGFGALKKERWRRVLLMLMLIFLAIAEAIGAFPVVRMLGIHELSVEFLIPAAFVLFIYPVVYAILAVLSAGRSMYLYRWIVAIMFMALVKDLPAFAVYFNAERLVFGVIVAVKFFSLLLALLIYRGLRSGISIAVTPGQPLTEQSPADSATDANAARTSSATRTRGPANATPVSAQAKNADSTEPFIKPLPVFAATPRTYSAFSPNVHARTAFPPAPRYRIAAISTAPRSAGT